MPGKDWPGNAFSGSKAVGLGRASDWTGGENREEWKKKEKKGCCGLLEEVQRMERVSLSLVEFAESFKFPMGDEAVDEVAVMVTEMAEVCRKMEEGLVPLQLQVREVFHRIVRSRAEVLDVLDQVGKVNTPVAY